MLPVAVVGLVAFAGLALLVPEAAAALSAKEGPLEHLGHGLLALALVGWLVVMLRVRSDDGSRRERWLCAALVLMCAVLLGEELDWGRVYGWSGHGNLHNGWRGASYVAFAMLPVVLVGVVGWRRGEAPGRLPRRRDAIGVVVLGVASLGGSLAWPAWEPRLDEVVETLFYMGLCGVVLRPGGRSRVVDLRGASM
jgi:hypothetical protein